jgi:BMFP domain-containing protein YqiC
MNVPIDDDDLVEHIVDHLCEEQAEALGALSDSEIERRVRLGLAAFVTLMFLVSPCFDRQPAIAAAIRSAADTPADRLRALFGKTKESDWDEAASAGTWAELA